MKTKNKIIFSLVALLVIYLAMAMIAPARIENKNVFEKNSFRIAHRCGAKNFPENTLFACKKIVENNLSDFLEMDVHLTKDNVLVVIHDDDVENTTNSKGAVKDFTYSEIQKLDAGYKFTEDGGKTFPYRNMGIKIDKLDNFFEALPNSKYYIEVKVNSIEGAKALAGIVKKFHMEDKVVVGSFEQNVKDELARLLPDSALFGSKDEIMKWVILQKLNLTGLASFPSHTLAIPPKRSILNIGKSFMKSARNQNIKVHVWTINEEAEMQRLLEIGVDGIMTDDPILMQKVLSTKK